MKSPAWRIATLALLLAAWALPATAAAPAGSVIGNQAAATYSDGSAVVRTVTSNLVTTTVQQVASVGLTANGAKTISAGGLVYYPQTLVNTGNGADAFALSSNGNGTGSFAFVSVLFFADANGDGVPDNAVPIVTTGALAAGQSFKFVVAGVVPPTAVAGNTNALVVTAASALTPATSASVTDTTTVTGQAVIGVVQGLDITAGVAPAGPRTITLTYTNTGNTTATAVTLTELIPSGMTYVAGSARWSGSGSTVLTDADAADNQGGVVYDQGVTLANRVTAVIASVPAGASGTLSYQVNINSGLPAGANAATASTGSFSYHDGATTIAASATNTVQYTVLPSSLVGLTGATVAAAAQGAVVSFADTVTNNGNVSDSFDLSTTTSTFPAGTTFQIFQADGVTPLADSNGNGVPDTGPLAAGASLGIVIKATLPTGATGGGYTVLARAQSRLDVTKFATALNTLTAITGNAVDLTNNTAGPGSSGYGAGPEGSVMANLNLAPGATGSFKLLATNGTGLADSYSLQASTDSSFATTVLPSGWSVVFKDEAGAIVDGTGTVNASASKTVYAHVSVSANASAAVTQLYFRAVSAATGASDRLHDSVTVGTQRGLTLTPNHAGQVTAAGTTVYSHLLVNTGNGLEADGIVSTGLVASSDSVAGFTSVVYWDKNNNGTLDPSDPVLTDLAGLVGGSNGASPAAGLTAGESVRLLVKVTAPAGAPSGTANVTTLSVTLGGTIGGIVAPAAVVATDASSVIVSNVTLVTMQALDANCDGVAETSFTTAPINSGAAPGGCLRYEVTATNAGPVAVTNLVISNATPAYTTYIATVAASATAGSVSAPVNGATGTLQVTVPTLASGATVVLRFGVRIDP